MFQSILRSLLLGLLLLLVACGATPQAAPPQASVPQVSAPQAGFTTISVQELKSRLDAGTPLRVLDVRSPEEYTQDGHLAGSTLMPLPELATRSSELAKDEPIACFCRSGNRSVAACEQLSAAGFTNLVNVDGGIRAWVAAGYPVE